MKSSWLIIYFSILIFVLPCNTGCGFAPKKYRERVKLLKKIFKTQAKGDVFEISGPWFYEGEPTVRLSSMYHSHFKPNKEELRKKISDWKAKRKKHDILPAGTRLQLVGEDFEVNRFMGGAYRIVGELRFKILTGKYAGKIVRYYGAFFAHDADESTRPVRILENKAFHKFYEDKKVRYRGGRIGFAFFSDNMKYLGKKPIKK